MCKQKKKKENRQSRLDNFWCKNTTSKTSEKEAVINYKLFKNYLKMLSKPGLVCRIDEATTIGY